MSAAQAAIDTIFADANMSVAAVWYTGGTGPGVPVRVILRSPDLRQDFGAAQVVSETVRLDVRVAEVSAPCAGDLVIIDGARLVVQGDGLRDVLRLVWRLEAEPEQ